MISPTNKRRVERLLASRRPRDASGRVVALCYHSVAPRGPASLAPDAFREHVAWLKDHCDVLPFGRIDERARKRNDRPTVAITFDDGYRDNAEYAVPALVEAGLTATFFVTTGLPNADGRTISRLARVWGVPPGDVVGLTWRDVADMQAAGMEIGAHTRTHPNLAQLHPADARREIVASKLELEDRLQREITSFAYPFGDVRFDLSAATVRIVRDAGFRSAASIHFRAIRPSDDRMQLPRFPIVTRSTDVMAAIVDGRLDVLGIARERAPRWVSRLASTGPRRRDDAA